MSDAPVVVSTRGRLGRLHLNRPRVINALNHEMVTIMRIALDAWRDDDAITTIVLTGAGERGLCAGGDMVSIYREGGAASDTAMRFWADEYRLDATIARYPKPFVALMDGLVLGGGIGIAGHARHRVVTQRSLLGMPETTIGFVPDVGGLHLLARAPGEMGTHAALTAAFVDAGDAITMRLADSYVPSDALPGLIEGLEHLDMEDALAPYLQDPPVGGLFAQRSWIDLAYAFDDVETIVASLRSSGSPGAIAAADAIMAKSPLALKVTLAAIRRARVMWSVEDVLNQDLRVSTNLHTSHDVIEGVRAQLIDKDRNPQWEPATLADISADMVEAAFAPIEHELGLVAP
ncbi:enoyl-CoA hydratase/isomerase family protein [soil metagenome]